MPPLHGSMADFDPQEQADASCSSFPEKAAHAERIVRRVRNKCEVEFRTKSVRHASVPDADERQRRIFGMLYRKLLNETSPKEVCRQYESH